MKKIFKYFFVLCFIVLFIGCEKKTEEPEILLFEAEPSTITLGDAVTFRFQVKADYVTLWTGNQETSSINRDYSGYLEQINNPPDTNEAVNRFYNKGIALAVTDSAYIYTMYKEAGSYTAVLIATNAGKMGEEYKRKQASIMVEVLDATQ
jgi:hypothetical protein